MLKRIHVNQHNIKTNRNNRDKSLPPITCKTSKGNFKGHGVHIEGDSDLEYSPENPIKCGAVLWIKTHAPVILYDEAGNTKMVVS